MKKTDDSIPGLLMKLEKVSGVKQDTLDKVLRRATKASGLDASTVLSRLSWLLCTPHKECKIVEKAEKLSEEEIFGMILNPKEIGRAHV